MNLRNAASAIVIVVLSIAGGIYTVQSGNQPNLGIDLQGGVSVVLVPTEPDEVSTEELDQAVEIIRSRVDGLGVAEPEIARQGDTISVILPGAEQQQRAVEIIGQTAELRFRPVLQDTNIPAFEDGDSEDADSEDEDGDSEASDAEDGDSDADSEDSDADSDAEDSDAEDSDSEDEGLEDTEDAVTESTTTTAPDDEEATQSGVDEEAAGSRVQPVSLFQGEDPTDEEQSTEPIIDEDADGEETVDGAEAEGDEDSTELEVPDEGDEGSTELEVPDVDAGEELTAEDLAALQAQSSGCGIPSLTPPSEDNPEDVVFLPDDNGLLVCLGPVYQATEGGEFLTGTALETAQVGQDVTGAWTVNPTFKAGASGIDLFNSAAAACNGQSAICPRGRLAAVLDQEVISAPTINAASFTRERVVVSGTFTQEQAEALALQLRFGALPVELETGPVRQISASTGDDVLEAGVLAGLIGLSIVAVYLLLYYRLAGLVAIGGLLLSGVLLWTIIAFIGARAGLALTLSGVVGLIVAIGVSADSNIVYFENVKDAYLQGRRVPTAIERAYQSAISTIVKADTVSLIAAVLLYFLTIGQVKGFALFLGLGTLLDLIISWTFMRPALAGLARLKAARKNPRLLGLPVRGDVNELRS